MKFATGNINLIFIALFLISGTLLKAQTLLGKPISLEINKQRLDNVLEIISNKGNFYFSYNSSIIKRDSLVSFSASDQPIKQILDRLFPDNFEFIESGNYIILRQKPISVSLVTTQDSTADKYYTITGKIIDGATGGNIANASVYEKQQLSSVLTNDNGYFKLKLRSRYSTANITVSKVFYKDTTVSIQPKFNQNVTIAILPIENEATIITVVPQDFSLPDTILFEVRNPSGTETYLYKRNNEIAVEKTGLGKFFLSAKQKAQSLNLRNFFANRPFQLSLFPGISTQGKMNPQVINNFSFNLFGGYSGGVGIIELGGLFNLDKKDVQYFQAAGLTNIVGGKIKGIQVAGLNNTVLGDADAAQFSMAANIVNGKMEGGQFSLIYNHVLGTMNGVQVAGLLNFTNKEFTGTQLAGASNISPKRVIGTQLSGVFNFAESIKGTQIGGFVNIAAKKTSGTQIATLFNYTRKLKGVQIGLINIADSLDGLSIGLLNISRNGYHKVSIGTNEIFDLNVALKTGSYKLYSILLGSINLHNDKTYSLGFGLGRENNLGKLVAVNTELTAQQIYLGVKNTTNVLTRLQANLNVKVSKHISIYLGPAYNFYYSDQTIPANGYKFNIPDPSKIHNLGRKVSGWIGWSAGIHLF